jgi:hypothetical protein
MGGRKARETRALPITKREKATRTKRFPRHHKIGIGRASRNTQAIAIHRTNSAEPHIKPKTETKELRKMVKPRIAQSPLFERSP